MRVQCIRQCFPSPAQFRKPFSGYPFNQLFTAEKQFHQDASAVLPALTSAQISVHLQPIDQFHCAVVLQQEALRECLNGRFRAFREAANRKQQQILLRFQPLAARRGIAFGKKETYAVAERGQGSVVGRCHPHCHQIIIS